jgi:excinuclease ABC subunit C
MAASPELRRQLDAVPESPGCYLYKDEAGKVIYVGKAINLRRRTYQYFQERADLSPKNQALVEHITQMETVVVSSEIEALILEENLIKKYRPRFNVLLRDDKRYPYLQLTLSEPYPRLLVSRRPHQAKDRYFGPFVHVGAMRETIRLVHRHLGIRQCDIEIDRKLERPCLYYDLHQCDAPCVAWGETHERYMEHVKNVQMLLDGREDVLSSELTKRMEEASAAERFEDAARWRDGLQALQMVRQKQRVVLPEPRDVDVVALAEGPTGASAVKVFFVRGGKLVDWQDCRLAHGDGAAPGEALLAFLQQFYAGATAVPQELLLSHALEDEGALEAWLSQKRGSKVAITVPQRGEKMALVRLCEANALEMLKEAGDEGGRAIGERRHVPQAPARDLGAALRELQQALGLAKPPRRIDGFDISHFQGSQTVASMVVMQDGRPARGEYRKFKVKTVEGVDDFASMEEVVGRRYKRVLEEGGPWPDLIMIDGGKGQLGAALKALRALDLDQKVAVIGLAKRFEEIFQPGKVESLRLGVRSPGRLLIQRLRDEAHRFAITFHRQLRSKALAHSELDDIDGVGPALKKRLLRAFGSVDGVRQASLDQLREVEGVGPRMAQRLKEALSPKAALPPTEPQA